MEETGREIRVRDARRPSRHARARVVPLLILVLGLVLVLALVPPVHQFPLQDEDDSIIYKVLTVNPFAALA